MFLNLEFKISFNDTFKSIIEVLFVSFQLLFVSKTFKNVILLKKRFIYFLEVIKKVT